jgi:hypothetical protein
VETELTGETAPSSTLREPRPGALWPWVKRASWFELALFAALCFFWLVPGFDHETLIFGAAHGIGYLALCALILLAILRRQAPYGLLAASLTPVGPLGSVIAIGYIERKWRGGAVGGRGSQRPAPPPARR